MRIAILPTGRMELLGVPLALKALFPAHDFYSVSKLPRDEEPFDSFTSSDKPLMLGKPNGNVDKLVQRMAAELFPGRDGRAPDLLIVLEDLELPNMHQPAIVVQLFRDAIERHLQRLQQDNPKIVAKVEEALRSKASFHLAVPMIEAWLFADPHGPRNAGAPAERLPPSWESEHDPEAFSTRDPAYLSDDCSACTAWHTLTPRKKKDHSPGWLKQNLNVHPKAFLAWLCRDPAEKNCSRYRETHEGTAALQALDFPAALRSPDHCMYLRALVDDLADGLGEELSFPLDGRAALITSHRVRRTSPVLRNI